MTCGAVVALALVMRNGLLLALVLVAVACGAYQYPGGSPQGTGTVTGHVVAVPCAPVEPAAKPCAGRPVSGLEIDYVKGEATAKVVTGPAGEYSVQLSGGTWLVHLKTYMRVVNGPPQVSVTPGSTVTAEYVVDSGMRVPQQ